MVIELKRDAIPNVVLNQLYKHTAMQSTFGVIMLALVKGAPKVMNLKELLEHFIEHRHEIIVRRTQFDLDAAQAREHILEGLKIAVDNIDEVIKIIRGSEDTPEADARLRKRFGLSARSRATRSSTCGSPSSPASRSRSWRPSSRRSGPLIKELKAILASKPKRMGILKSEMAEVAKQFGDDRRTEIIADQGEFTVEDLIAEEDMVITISHSGYIKRIPVTHLQAAAARRPRPQRRRPQGRRLGRAPVHRQHPRLPAVLHRHGPGLLAQGARDPAGAAARRAASRWCNCIAIKPDEQIAALVPVREFTDDQCLIFATRQGTVKKTVLSAYGNVRTNGISAINIEKGDELIDVQVSDGEQRHRPRHHATG